MQDAEIAKMNFYQICASILPEPVPLTWLSRGAISSHWYLKSRSLVAIHLPVLWKTNLHWPYLGSCVDSFARMMEQKLLHAVFILFRHIDSRSSHTINTSRYYTQILSKQCLHMTLWKVNISPRQCTDQWSRLMPIDRDRVVRSAISYS